MISPHEFKKLREVEVKQLEDVIDYRLRQAKGKTPIRISVDLLDNLEYLEEVLSKYRISGWKVDLIADPRDGDYLEFKL